VNIFINQGVKLVAGVGFEPTTFGLWARTIIFYV